MNGTSIHSLSHHNQKLWSLPRFFKFHLDTFYLDKSRMQSHRSSLLSPSLRDTLAASNFAGLVLPSGQRAGFLTTLQQWILQAQYSSDTTQIHCRHSIRLGSSTSALWNLQAMGTVRAACWAISKSWTQKSHVFYQHPWNSSKLLVCGHSKDTQSNLSS